MKSILVLIITLLVTGPLISQPFQTRDSSLIANKDLRKAAIIIEQGKVVASQLKLQERRGDLLQQSNEMKDSIIASHLGTIYLKDKMIVNYKAINEANTNIIALQEKAMADLRKSLQCQKVRTWFTSALAVASVAFVVFRK